MALAADLPAIVLAAGFSRRAAPHHKLLLPAPDGSGRLVVRATVEAVCAAGCSDVVVVTGHEHARIEAALAGLPVRCVYAADFSGGMGHSLAAGVPAAPAHARGFAVTPADLPRISGALVRSVIEYFISKACGLHVIPVAAGVRRHPVVLGAWLRPQLEALAGDAAAGAVLAGEKKVTTEPAPVANVAHHFAVASVRPDLASGPESRHPAARTQGPALQPVLHAGADEPPPELIDAAADAAISGSAPAPVKR